jgi:hypothetical protein
MMKTMLAAVATVALLAADATGPALAQNALPLFQSKDDLWIGYLAKREKSAIVWSVILVNASGGTLCMGPSLQLRSVGEKGKSITVHSSAFLVNPGRYDVVSARCSGGFNKGVYRGPHARIDAPAGQVVDLGTLRLEYDVKTDNIFTGAGAGTVKRSVLPLPADQRASLKESLPKVMARAVTRHMTLIGPATTTVKQRRRFF